MKRTFTKYPSNYVKASNTNKIPFANFAGKNVWVKCIQTQIESGNSYAHGDTEDLYVQVVNISGNSATVNFANIEDVWTPDEVDTFIQDGVTKYSSTVQMIDPYVLTFDQGWIATIQRPVQTLTTEQLQAYLLNTFGY